MLETNENEIINVIIQFIPCIISFFLDILSAYFMNSLNRNPRIYTIFLIIPAETIIKKKNKEEHRSIAFWNARISRRCSRDIIS